MFNLEEQIQSWRKSISIILGDRPELLDELENHLRDDFKRSLADGKSDAESWELALRNLGDQKQLAGEFGKVEAARWMPANIAEIMVAIGVVALIWRVLHSMSAGKIGPLLAWHIVVVTIAYWAMLTIGFLAIWAVILHTVGGLQDRQINAMRAVVARLSWVSVAGMALGIVLGGFWAQDHSGPVVGMGRDGNRSIGRAGLGLPDVAMVCRLSIPLSVNDTNAAVDGDHGKHRRLS